MGTTVIPAEWKNTPEFKAITAIRTLSMDAVQQANSGHPGTPVAMAPVVYTLWQRFLRFDPQDPIWGNRDRFVLSMGHASMLLYSMLHLTKVKAVNAKYERLDRPTVTLDDIKTFRQINSRCAGHPEYRWTSGIETTTGPLGNGVATRFLGYGWNVTRVADANDVDMLERAFKTFKNTKDRPTLIIVDSHIAWGVPGKEGHHSAHGEPLGWDKIEAAKEFYGCSKEKVCVPDGVYDHFRKGIGKRGKEARDAGFAKFSTYKGR